MSPEQAIALRRPFPPESVGKLPKAGVMLDFVGHAAVTDRLLSVDPEWTWRPFTLEEMQALPPAVRDAGLWIHLTICGVERIGVGDGSSAKECIGDAIRNAAMRFGVALDLWAKEALVEFAQAARGAPNSPVTSGGVEATAGGPQLDPVAPPAESPLLNTSSKLAKAMYAGINEAGIEEADRIAWVGNVIGREIASTKEMTDAEARDVLAFIDAQKAGAA